MDADKFTHMLDLISDARTRDILGRYHSEMLALRSSQYVSLQTAKLALASERLECKRLLRELHQTQEHLAQFLLERPGKLSDLQNNKILKLLSKLPNHWEFDSISVTNIENGADSKTIWSIKEAYLDNVCHPEIIFELEIQGENIIIKADRNLNSWLASSQEMKTLTISSVSGSVTPACNNQLSELSSACWFRLNELITRVRTVLETPKDYKLPEDIKLSSFKFAFANIETALRCCPERLRYDDVVLQDVTIGTQYKALRIKLLNLSLGKMKWDSFEYALATVDLGDDFGENPRLEFTKTSVDVLSSIIISEDDFNEGRLEIRFAHPNKMNIDVWNQLSGHDQIFVTAILTSLNQQLSALQNSTNTYIDFGNWKHMSSRMVKILSNIFHATHGVRKQKASHN